MGGMDACASACEASAMATKSAWTAMKGGSMGENAHCVEVCQTTAAECVKYDQPTTKKCAEACHACASELQMAR